jgi:putative acetyltransferase
LLHIRPETREDVPSIHNINVQAFGREAEAVVFDKIRERGALKIALVAVENGALVGYIAFSQVDIVPKLQGFCAMTLAPLSVLPAYQKRGIGSALVKAGLEECQEQGQDAVFLVGHSDYYPRFGFVPAREKGFECEYEAPDEAWMVLELKEGALFGKQGRVKFQPEFREAATQ